MDILDLQLAEIELLQCSFESELKIESPCNLEELRTRHQNGDSVSLSLVFSLNFDKFNLWVDVPDLYPKVMAETQFKILTSEK